MTVPKTTDEWLAMVKSFGLPVVILGVAAWLFWHVMVEQQQFIRDELLEMNRSTTVAVENSTRAMEECIQVIRENQELSRRIEEKLR